MGEDLLAIIRETRAELTAAGIPATKLDACEEAAQQAIAALRTELNLCWTALEAAIPRDAATS
jgi:hypothetical protein